MIDTDRFLNNGDGSAWLVVSANEAADAYGPKWANRPCDDLCDHGSLSVTAYDDLGPEDEVMTEGCEPCQGTGRHCFDLEVEDTDAAPIYLGHPMTITHRVYVLNTYLIGDDETTGEGFLYGGPNWFIVGGGTDQPNIILPDAKPGDTAVHLQIVKQQEET